MLKSSLLPRIAAWSLVALTASLIPFSGQLGTKTLAQDLPTLKNLRPTAAHLHMNAPEKVTEGQPFSLQLAFRNIPAATRLEPAKLTLRYSDTSYNGKPIAVKKPLQLGISPYSETLLFQSPGEHKIDILDDSGTVWKTQTVNTEPFAASIFPEHHKDYPELSKNPEDFHVWVNLHYDPKQPKKQRQHLQITYKDRLLERLLISSGAPGHATPQGTYKVGFKDYYPRSAKYNNTPMPFWSAINMNGNEGEYGFHSLEGGGYLYLLGRPASHGCIRLSRMASVETNPETGEKFWGDRGGARWIYDRIPRDTPIHIFTHSLPAFAYEDYQMYLTAQAEAYRKKQQQKS